MAFVKVVLAFGSLVCVITIESATIKNNQDRGRTSQDG
jgi:hypothetical protein